MAYRASATIQSETFRSSPPNNIVSITGGSEPTAAVLDVRATYRWLAKQAQDAGAQIRTGTAVTGALKDDSGSIRGVTVSEAGSESEYRADIVIDASGFGSAVCRAMGMGWQWNRFGAGAEYEAEAENVDPDTWWLMVGQMYSPAGYAWIFPVGGSTVRIGVGVGKPESDADPTRLLNRLMADKTGPHRIAWQHNHHGVSLRTDSK